MNDTYFSEYFHQNKELIILNYNIRYMNSLSLLRTKELANIPYHMIVVDHDIWNGPVIPIKFNSNNFRTKIWCRIFEMDKKTRNIPDIKDAQQFVIQIQYICGWYSCKY